MFNLNQSHFRDDALYRFFQYGEASSTIPANLTSVLARKLDMINAAENLSPPANRLELLDPKQNNVYSIRVNKTVPFDFQV